jgi:eukaryotic-like serine/threonine-protein kinase
MTAGSRSRSDGDSNGVVPLARLHAAFSGADSDIEATRAQRAIAGRLFGRAAPVVVGRFELRECIGAGGMGLVYAAHDPLLDRVVALKLVRLDREDHASDGHKHLRAEAQALAGLNHPNVVTIYDVGQVDETLYVAMELVSGSDLRRWLECERTATEIAGVFRDVAAGVAAAHAAGIVHRDIKPENILVGEDGRARVADFGLARLARSVNATTVETAITSVASTQPAGTPGYVAPEVLAGAPADERSDVYAYCVTLHEALYGRWPDAGSLPPTRTRTGEKVPSDVVATVARGLAPYENRLATIADLAIALARWPARTRRGLVVSGAVVSIALAALAIERAHSRSRIGACQHEADAMVEVWNDAAHTRLHEHVIASDTALARDAAPRAIALLDDYSARWSAARSDVCRRAQIDHAMAVPTYARARACFDERRHRFAALLDVAAEADDGIAATLVAMVVALPAPEACADEALLATGQWSDDPARNAQMADLVRALARVSMLEVAGRHEEGLAISRDVARRAHERGLDLVVADAEGWAGWFLARLGRYDEAEEALESAFYLATREQADMLAARSAGALTHVVGGLARRYDEGLEWGRHAESAVARSGIEEPALSAMISLNLANVLSGLDDDAGAFARQQRALALYEEAFGPDHPQVAKTLSNMSLSALSQGRADDARAYALRALAIREAVLGPNHPDVAHVHSSLGTIAFETGAVEQALFHYEQALASSTAAFGTEHPTTARFMANLGMLESDVPGRDGAMARLEEALAILERTLGSDHPDTAQMMEWVADRMLKSGQIDRAERLLLRGLSSCEVAQGTNRLACSHIIESLGLVAYARRGFDDALTYHRRALGIREQANERRAKWVATSLVAIGMIHLERGAPDEAIPVLERALELRIADGLHPDLVAEARHRLAVALWEGGGDRARSLALAEQAADEYRALGPMTVEALRDLDGWLAARREVH